MIESDQILNMLPHRYPIMLLDRIVEMEPGESIIGLKNVTFNEPHFQGHFPGKAVMPGVLIVEAMAQASAVCVVNTFSDAEAGNKIIYFMTIDGVRFRKPVIPPIIACLPIRTC